MSHDIIIDNFISSLSPAGLKKLVEMTRNVAGPWEENRYDAGRQWARTSLRGSSRAPTHSVLRWNDGSYRVMTSFEICPTVYVSLDEARAAADVVMRGEKWILLDE